MSETNTCEHKNLLRQENTEYTQCYSGSFQYQRVSFHCESGEIFEGAETQENAFRAYHNDWKLDGDNK